MINYSDRFTITGLTGSTDSQFRKAAETLNGATNGPPSVGDAATSSTSSSTLATTTAAQRHSPTTSNAVVTITRGDSTTATRVPGNGPSNSQDSGLSTNILVGIAIAGAAVGVIGISLAIWAFLRKRRRKERGVKLDDNSDPSIEVARKEMTVATPVELDPYARIVEADNGMPPAEMPSNNFRAELEGDSTHGEVCGSPVVPLTPVPDTPVSTMTLGTGTMGTWRSMTMDTLESPVTPRDNV